MKDIENKLHLQKIPKDLTLSIPQNDKTQCVSKSDAAIAVMTDLNKVPAFHISCDASLEATNDKMIACGVRLLFVKEQNGKLAGIITAEDILGEKPLLFVNNNRVNRDDVKVRDIMTPVSKLKGLPIEYVKTSRVGDVVSALKRSRRHHMLVLENIDHTDVQVRGIFSITQVSRQLGEEVISNERAESFAQLQAALA